MVPALETQNELVRDDGGVNAGLQRSDQCMVSGVRERDESSKVLVGHLGGEHPDS